jgi:uncharacterized surface protein with fasciclin (FAS1) repeats
MIKMSKTLRYFLFSTLVLSVLFLASCEEDPDGPVPSSIIVGTEDGDLSENDTLFAAPGSQVTIGASTGIGSTDDISVVTNNSSVVSVPSNNSFASGDSITVDIASNADLGDEATLTFTSGTVNRQVIVEVGYQTVVDAALATSNLSILVDALTAANLVSTLDDPNASYTVFAPTNQAFQDLIAALNTTAEDLLARDDLEDILLYHVVGQAATSDQLENGDVLTTLNSGGFSVVVTIDGTDIEINGASVVTPNVSTGNGVVHIIDEVLLPEEVAEYEAVLLNAPVGQGAGNRTSDTFFDSSTGMTYSVDDVVGGADGINSGDIDFGYYYGATNEASLAAPSDYPSNIYDLGPNGANWNTLNSTSFRPVNNLTLDDFNNIGPADAARLVQEYEIATEDPVTEITNLSAGELYAFQTSDNRYGIVFISEIIDGNNDGEFDGVQDSIELEVKVTP